MAVSLLLAFLAAALLVSCAQTADYLGAPCIGDVCDNGMECLSLDGGNCTWDGFNMDSPCSCGGAGVIFGFYTTRATDVCHAKFILRGFLALAAQASVHQVFKELVAKLEQLIAVGWALFPGGESDPYFTGFSGQSFYFRAEAGNVYNVYSEQVLCPRARDLCIAALAVL